MRIFLCGGGDGIQALEAYRKLSDIMDKERPLLYVPLAMNEEEHPYNECLNWIKNELSDFNINKIEMVRTFEEFANKDYYNYSAIFIGGGNTYKLLKGIKDSRAFGKLKEFIINDGIVFGGSAGAIIFGKDLDACKLDDTNDVNLKDTEGFDVLNGISLLCHYTNRTIEKDKQSTEYLLSISSNRELVALPEEDTIFINGDDIELIGNKSYYIFKDGEKKEIRNSNII